MKRLILDELYNSIPNMRFIACKVIANTFRQYTNEVNHDDIIRKLTSMTKDEDVDVQYYSIEAMKTVLKGA